MLIVKERERYTADVFDDELPVARIYYMGASEVLVKMFEDDYELTVDSIDTALKAIRIRNEKPTI